MNTEPQKNAGLHIVLCAGGTGGHMFPALSLASDLRQRGYQVTLMTDQRGQKFTTQFPAHEIKYVPAAPVGPGLIKRIKGIFILARGYFRAKRLLKKIRPETVVGFGGYPSLPGLRAAQDCRIPTVIHEQNAVLGHANKFLAPRADRIALSFPDRASLEDADKIRAVITGNPVRNEISALANNPYAAPEPGQTPFKLLVIGGSLGAHVFSELIPKAIGFLPESARQRLSITQQCRAEDLEKVRGHYQEIGVQPEIATFFEDFARLLSEAHLVIARAGASTVAELAAAGRPAIFIPYPHHADRQQQRNASVLTERGGGWLMTEEHTTADVLAARLAALMDEPETLFRVAEAARQCGRPDAARRLGNLVTALASGWDKDALAHLDYTQGFMD